MGFSTIDWVALFILGVSALVGTFGKRLLRIEPRTNYQQRREYQYKQD
jgi:hypothetical protein